MPGAFLTAGRRQRRHLIKKHATLNFDVSLGVRHRSDSKSHGSRCIWVTNVITRRAAAAMRSRGALARFCGARPGGGLYLSRLRAPTLWFEVPAHGEWPRTNTPGNSAAGVLQPCGQVYHDASGWQTLTANRRFSAAKPANLYRDYWLSKARRALTPSPLPQGARGAPDSKSAYGARGERNTTEAYGRGALA